MIFVVFTDTTLPIPGPNVPYLQRTSTVPYPASPAEPLGTLTHRPHHARSAPQARLALLCSTGARGSGLLCGLDHFMDSVNVAARRCLREALRVVDEEGSHTTDELPRARAQPSLGWVDLNQLKSHSQLTVPERPDATWQCGMLTTLLTPAPH